MVSYISNRFYQGKTVMIGTSMQGDNNQSALFTTLSLFLTPAALSAVVAYGQLKIAQNKLRWDLFEKRLSVYQSAMTIISNLNLTGQVSEEDWKNFILEKSLSQFILSREIYDFLNEISIEASKFQAHMRSIPDEQSKYFTNDHADQKFEARARLSSFLADKEEELNTKFKPFLAVFTDPWRLH